MSDIIPLHTILMKGKVLTLTVYYMSDITLLHTILMKGKLLTLTVYYMEKSMLNNAYHKNVDRPIQ